MILVLENLDNVAPKEVHSNITVRIRFIIVILYYLKKDTSEN